MEKLDLCRLCLANSMNANMLPSTKTMERTMRQFNMLYSKSDFSMDSLKLICEPCWTRIDDFRQFSMHVENIHISYVRHFLKDDGTFNEFDDISQYYVQVDDIHNMYAQLLKNGSDDKKFDYIEPFCVINVDENETNALKNRLNEASTSSDYVPTENDQLASDVGISGNEMECKNVEATKSDVTENSCNVPVTVDDTVETDEEVDEDDVDVDDVDVDDVDVDDVDVDDDDDEGDSDWSEEQKKLPINKTNKKHTNKETIIAHGSDGTNKKSKYLKSGLDFGSADERSQLLLKYVQLKCDLCFDREFRSFADVQRHFWAEHEQSGYVICCNRKFRRLARILQHCRWHENPEAFKCEKCNKCFQDNVCLRDHITLNHIPVDERRYQCEQCSRLFAKQHLLNTHLKMKHTVKEERPFPCPEANCEQRFVLPAYLRMHVEKVHNNSDSAVCDICARFFKCSKSYERHYQVVHTNIDHRVQCDLCKKWFKHLDTLKDHIRRHYAASATCKHCGRVSSNKKSLRVHIRNVHADVDSSVKKRNEFPCTVCDKLFKKKQTLREHMTLHTGEAYLYTCTFCSKTFRSSANMYAHRKRNHPKEYEEKCLLPKTQKN